MEGLSTKASLKSAKTICGDSFHWPVGDQEMLKSSVINLGTPMEVGYKLNSL